MENATPLNIVQDFLCVAIQKIHTGKLGLVARKPVFGVSDKASFKTVSSATETS